MDTIQFIVKIMQEGSEAIFKNTCTKMSLIMYRGDCHLDKSANLFLEVLVHPFLASKFDFKGPLDSVQYEN